MLDFPCVATKNGKTLRVPAPQVARQLASYIGQPAEDVHARLAAGEILYVSGARIVALIRPSTEADLGAAKAFLESPTIPESADAVTIGGHA